MSSRFIILTLIIFTFSVKSFASDTTEVAQQKSFELFEWGLSFSYGFVNEKIGENRYEPFLFMAHLEFHPHRKQRNPNSPHYFLLFAEPQANPVLFGGGIKDWEMGCNIGIKYLAKIKERNSFFVHAGSGPQFISINAPEHQANGFAFANNFGIGYQRLFKNDIHITIGYRFRHVSNLDLQLPNAGLDNHFLSVGFKKEFAQRIQARMQRKQERLLEE
jgi:hypothetical protein